MIKRGGGFSNTTNEYYLSNFIYITNKHNIILTSNE
jgi:hypothetical protein